MGEGEGVGEGVGEGEGEGEVREICVQRAEASQRDGGEGEEGAVGREPFMAYHRGKPNLGQNFVSVTGYWYALSAPLVHHGHNVCTVLWEVSGGAVRHLKHPGAPKEHRGGAITFLTRRSGVGEGDRSEFWPARGGSARVYHPYSQACLCLCELLWL